MIQCKDDEANVNIQSYMDNGKEVLIVRYSTSRAVPVRKLK